MHNILEGLQYRELNPHLPSWGTEKYGDWQDIKGAMTFPTGTQFRVAPRFTFVVSDADDKPILTSTDKTEAMAKVSSRIAEGHFAGIRKEELTSLPVSAWLSEKGIQYQIAGLDKWVHGQYFNPGISGVSNRVKFRVRPDTYFQVQIQTGIAMSTLDFDDVDKLSDYLDKQLRTSENNITITRRSYGLTL